MTDYVTVRVEGVGPTQFPRRLHAAGLQQWTTHDHGPRLVWRGDECLYDPDTDDPMKPIELNDGDYLVFATKGYF